MNRIKSIRNVLLDQIDGPSTLIQPLAIPNRDHNEGESEGSHCFIRDRVNLPALCF